ncbi:hypothetical protein [Paradesulfitobacterium ferrireducens]|uniref:hypothetical protein n=1 Tax=Paradesulfitobacterium ferrireducens TaxID=2816476 RepID=UPI001A8DC79C|nr:hypothetical protein [Paradesulfitobacterium ferrireducens]
MWEFISQNWWILLFIGMMFFMHRPGGAGCCGGGHQHGQRRNSHDHVYDLEGENNKARLQD